MRLRQRRAETFDVHEQRSSCGSAAAWRQSESGCVGTSEQRQGKSARWGHGFYSQSRKRGDVRVVQSGLVRFYPNLYGLREIEGILIPSKFKFLSIRINTLPFICIENNRTSF